MTITEPTVASSTIRVTAYPSSTLDAKLVPGTSDYVEFVFTSIIGPTAVLAYRNLLRRFADEGEAYRLDVAELAIQLGVPTAQATRAIKRLVDFRIARWDGDTLQVRLAIKPPSERVLAARGAGLLETHHRILATDLLQR